MTRSIQFAKFRVWVIHLIQTTRNWSLGLCIAFFVEHIGIHHNFTVKCAMATLSDDTLRRVCLLVWFNLNTPELIYFGIDLGPDPADRYRIAARVISNQTVWGCERKRTENTTTYDRRTEWNGQGCKPVQRCRKDVSERTTTLGDAILKYHLGLCLRPDLKWRRSWKARKKT